MQLFSRRGTARRSTRVTNGVLRPLASRLFHCKQPESPRRYIPLRTTAAAFFRNLLRRNTRYVALRWFEDFPNITPGEDIDLLVDDADLSAMENILRPEKEGIPCDVYTVSGLPATNYRSMAYYPPYLAEQILDRRVLFKDLLSTPSCADYFLSLAYHAIYHKGLNAGIPTSLHESATSDYPDHDYAKKLAMLATKCGIDYGELTMEALDDCLSHHGWRPPIDTLAKLMPGNRWIKRRFFSASSDFTNPIFRGLVVFVLRERALQLQVEADILEILYSSGFGLLAVKHLRADEAVLAARRIRGGDWGRGPWPTSGGGPAAIVVGHDTNPLPVPESLRRQHALLDNARIPAAKESVRNSINSRVRASQQCNVIHSSDSAQHAVEYLRITMPEREEEIISHLRNVAVDADSHSPLGLSTL